MKREFTLTLSLRRQKLGWAYLLFELLVLPMLLFAAGDAAGITSEVALNGIYYILNFIVCVVLFRQMLLQSLRNFAARPLPLLAAAAMGFAAVFAADRAMGLVLRMAAPEFANVNDQALGQMIRQAPGFMLLCVGFLVPVAEECLFRGLLFAPLYGKNPRGAYALSVLCFAAVHVLGYVGLYPASTLALCFLQYLPAGLALCLAMARTDSLAVPILIHCAVNLTGFLSLR